MEIHFVMTKRFSKREKSIKTECGIFLKYSDINVTFGVYKVTCENCLQSIIIKDIDRVQRLVKIKDKIISDRYFLPLTKEGEAIYG